MDVQSGSTPRSYDRRRWPRVKLAVPVQFGKGSWGKGELLYFTSGESSDVSTVGVRLTTSDPGPFIPGEVLAVSIAIPWELRRAFPFSRIVGAGRVVRVEEGPATEQGKQQRLAIEFYGDRTAILGSIMTP